MLLLNTNKRHTLIMLNIMFNSDMRRKAAFMLGLYKLLLLFCYRILLRAIVVLSFYARKSDKIIYFIDIYVFNYL